MSNINDSKRLVEDLHLNTGRLEAYNKTLDFKLDEIDNAKQVDELRAFTYAIDRERKDIENKIEEIYRSLHELEVNNE